MTDNHSPALGHVTPLWSDAKIDELVYDTFGVQFTHDDWVFEEAIKIAVSLRDAWAQDRAALQQRLAEANARSDAMLGIGTPHLDGLTETELERYSQLSPPEMFRALLRTEAQLDALRTERQGQAVDLREALAEYAHDAWSGWMKYLFGKGDFVPWTNSDGKMEARWVMPNWAVDRWSRQMRTPYADLPEEEKKSDRAEADTMLAIMSRTAPPANPVGAQWVPLIDGSGDLGTHTVSIEVSGSGLVLRSKATGEATFVGLPPSFCLCRLVQQEGN